MKIHLLTFVLLTIPSAGAEAQTDEVPWYYELQGEAGRQADSLLDLWMATEYQTILKRNKLKMSCKKCTSVYIDVIFLIERDGSFIDYEVVQSRKCGEEFDGDLQGEFVFFFAQIKFPTALRELRFRYRLGTSLSC